MNNLLEYKLYKLYKLQNYIYCVIFSSKVHICGLHQLLRNKMITFEIGARTESFLEQVICHLIKM